MWMFKIDFLNNTKKNRQPNLSIDTDVYSELDTAVNNIIFSQYNVYWRLNIKH